MFDLIDRYRGCLLGLAVGDALGTTLEFSPPGTFKPIIDMTGGGPFRLEPGQWTDDTSMALCLAASLVEKDGFDPVDQMQRYVNWYRHGYMSSNGRCFDIGNTTRQALTEFEKTNKPLCGSTHHRSAGNGSLMRLAPVPLYYALDPIETIDKSGLSSKTTHAHQLCIDACRYFAALIVGSLQGVSKSELLSQRYSPVPGYWEQNPLLPEIDEVASGSYKKKQPPEIKGSGYVVKSLEAALWAFHNGDSFRDGCLLAVNLGDDADTTGAIYGQLAGAYYGAEGIPASWLKKLAEFELIKTLAEQLSTLIRKNRK